MSNELLAVIHEASKVGELLVFPKVNQFFYSVGAKVKSFDYKTGVATKIHEGMSPITCMARYIDTSNNSKFGSPTMSDIL